MSAQDFAAALVAALALAWLAWRAWRARRRGAQACAGCPAGTPVAGVRPAPQPQLLVAIGEPPAPGPAGAPGPARTSRCE